MSTHGHRTRSREPTTVSRTKSNIKKAEKQDVKKDVEIEDDRRSEKEVRDDSLTDVRDAEERKETPQEEEETETNIRDPSPEAGRGDETYDRNSDEEQHEKDQVEPESHANTFSDKPPTKEEDPKDFDSHNFLGNVDEISQLLQDDKYRVIDADFPSGELKAMVSDVTTTVTNFKNYSVHSQKQLEGLRGQMRDMKDKIHKKIQQNTLDTKGNERMSYEERELQLKLANINKEVAKAAEELARAAHITIETESAAVEASTVAEQAASEAKIIQEEYEKRRKAEEETRRAEQEKRLDEERKKNEEARITEENKRREDEKRSRLRKEEQKSPAWHKWEPCTYNLDQAGEFDGGIGCIIRGNPKNFRDNDVILDSVEPLESTFQCQENEELVGNIIKLSGRGDAELKAPVYVALPHCITRAAAMTREPIVKAEKGDKWVELNSEEVSFEEHKDVKFVQAAVPAFTNLAVVTRFKKDYLVMPKKGGKLPSGVDHRVTFTAERGTFKKSEHFVMQLQPVDTVSLAEIKNKTKEGKGLLNCSAIVSMEWTSKNFDNPLLMTLPVPPNPVKARKAAAARAAKEAKMKNTRSLAQLQEQQEQEEKKRKKKNDQRDKRLLAVAAAMAEEEEKPKEVTKWYMGQYGNNDEDENDLLYFVQKDGKKWHTAEHMRVTAVKLDMVAFELFEPIDKFMVLRTRTNVEAREAQQIATAIANYLSQRAANVIVKQRTEDPNDVIIHMVPHTKTEKTIKKLNEEGYEEGPGASNDVVFHESDVIQLGFRGNVDCEGEVSKLITVYNSNVNTCLRCRVSEVDKFLQRSYQVYRGFLQVFRRTTHRRKPSKEEVEKGAEADEEIVEHKKELITELLISLPKEPMTHQPFVNTPVTFKTSNNDAINEDILHQLAGELELDWQKVAYYLNVRRMRIQAILRNTAQSETRDEDAAYDMLVSWAKRVPRGMSKSSILIGALSRSGRYDLADQVHDIEQDHKKGKRSQPPPSPSPRRQQEEVIEDEETL